MHTSRTAHATGPGEEQHPGLETLAAFLDGRLPDAERAQVMKHLAACKACFGLFADTARTLRELEPAGGTVVRFPFDKPALRRALPLAAAAVLVLAAGLVAYRWLRPPLPQMDYAELVAPLRDKPGLSEKIWDNPTRGGGDEQLFASSARGFQLGARLVDFQLSVEAGKAEKAARAAQRIAIVLTDHGYYPDEAEAFMTASMALREEGASTGPYRDLVEKALTDLGGFSSLPVNFGVWTAAGRLYALAGDSSFFERQANRRFLELLLEDPERLEPDGEPPPKLREDVRAELQEVAASWDAAERDYDEIAESLTRILVLYENMTEDFGE